jgi:hypothetical protein
MDNSVYKPACFYAGVPSKWKDIFISQTLAELIVWENGRAEKDSSLCQSLDLVDGLYDQEIINEWLGGKTSAIQKATTAGQLLALCLQQVLEGKGKLLTSGAANLFYMVGPGEQLVCVRFAYANNRWQGGVSDLKYLWLAGDRVFHNE